MKDEYVSSDFIAQSININPVLVRKAISNLKKAGLIESKEGNTGGSRLAKCPSEITLDKVYHAMDAGEVNLFNLARNTPNSACPIGSCINNRLNMLYDDVEGAVLEKLRSVTLEEFHRQFV